MSSKKKSKKKEVAPHSEAGVGGAAQPADGAMEASPAWERGTVVQLFGLVGRPELNEAAGMVAHFDEARGRYAVTVELLDRKPILIKPTNLRPWPPINLPVSPLPSNSPRCHHLRSTYPARGVSRRVKIRRRKTPPPRPRSAPTASPPTANIALPSRRKHGRAQVLIHLAVNANTRSHFVRKTHMTRRLDSEPRGGEQEQRSRPLFHPRRRQPGHEFFSAVP